MRSLGLALLLGGLPAAAGAQAPTATLGGPALRLTLDEALARVDAANEALGIARAQARQAGGNERAAKSGFLPQLTGTASYTRTLATQFSGFAAGADTSAGPVGPCNGYRPDPNLPLDQRVGELERAVDCSVNASPFGGANIPFGQRNNWNFGLALTQTLFDRRLIGNARAAAAQARAARIGIDVQRAQALLETASAYYDALLADRLAAIADSTLAQAERTLRDVELGARVGTQAEFDLLRARVARDNQVPVAIQRRTQRRLARVRLLQLLDLPPERDVELATPVPLEGAVDEVPLPAAAAALRDAADTLAGARAVVRTAEQSLQASEGTLAAATGERLPVLSAGSDYARIGFGSRFLPDWNDFVDDWNVFVRLQLPLFTGGRIAGRAAAARAGRDEAALRLKQQQELAARDAITVAAAREAAAATWAASRGTVEQAERAYAIAELRFREGISTQTELTDARLQLDQARATRAQAARDLLVARLREALLGYLPTGTADAAFLGGAGR